MLTTCILVSFGLATAVMLSGYVYSLSRNYYSIVDVLWAYSFSLIALVLIYFVGLKLHYLLIAIPMSMWSLRLGTHLLFRLSHHFPEEDGRYRDLKEAWQTNLKGNFFGFYMFQAVSVPLLALPLILVAAYGGDQFSWWPQLGLLLWFLAWVGESVADAQLAKFRSDPKNKGGVCQVGLWRYSRHPNYFFEWLIWVGFAIIATPVAYGYLAWISPIVMYLLLNYVTGIPYAEKQSLRSRGEAFRQYQLKTSRFFPWLVKS